MVAPRVFSNNWPQIKNLSQKIINHGGEGVILRKLLSLYEKGRSLSLLKLKVLEVGRLREGRERERKEGEGGREREKSERKRKSEV
jgi:ATP-dependent DNA ligase